MLWTGVDVLYRDKKTSTQQCIKALDFALAGPAGTKCCETFVEALGLKTIFSSFMGKVRISFHGLGA